MSRARKHLTLGLQGAVEAPGEGQRIVRALGSRGSNLVEVEFPGGGTTLCLLPSKFNKKLWIKRGGYLVVEQGGLDTTSPSEGGGGSSGGGGGGVVQEFIETVGCEEAHGDGTVEASAAPGVGDGGGGGGSIRKGSAITGIIAAVLYEEQVKQLKKMPGVWPEEFDTSSTASATAAAASAAAAAAAAASAASAAAACSRQDLDGVGDGGEASVEGATRGACGDQAGSDQGEEDGDSDDDGLPPLEPNTNHKVIEYDVMSDSSDEDE